jgi:glycosyltransferase involved in cell wall biosynthesis
MDNKKNLCIIVPNSNNDRLFKDKLLIDELSSRFNIKVVVLSGKSNDDFMLDNQESIFLGIDQSDSILKYPINYYQNIKELKSIKLRFKIDKSISFGKKANIINVLSKNKDETILKIDEIEDDSFVLEQFVKRFYKRADNIIVNSKAKMLFLNKEYKIEEEKINIIEELLPIDLISEKAAEEIKPELKKFFENKVIVTHGELAGYKGQWHLIKAFFRLKEKIDDIKLLIIGDGPLYEDLNELINSMNMEDDIKIIKELENPYKYLIRSDIYVLSSHFEYNKYSILDAMACARPIVSTACYEEIIRLLSPNNYVERLSEPFMAEYGILVPVSENELNTRSKVLNRNEIILSNAIFKLLNDYQLYDNYMEKSARKAIEFSVKSTADRWTKVIK